MAEADRPARVRVSSFGRDEELSGELPPALNLEKFQKQVNSALKEYFISGTLDDTVRSISELLENCQGFADEFGVLSIRAALDRDQSAHQAVVKLLKGVSDADAVMQSDVVRTFEKLFCSWEDIAIDAPKAPEALLMILLNCTNAGIMSKDILCKVPEALLAAGLPKDGSNWPAGHDILVDTAAALKEYKSEMAASMKDFFNTNSAEMVDRRLRELGQKQYRHELVKRAIVSSLEQQDVADARESVGTLFRHLSDEGLLSKDDLQLGVTRTLAQLSDLELDCPKAAELITVFLISMLTDELVSIPFLRRCRALRIGGPQGIHVLDVVQRKTPEYSKKDLGTFQFKKEVKTMITEYFNSGDKVEFTRRVRELAPLPCERGAEIVRKVMHLAMEYTSAECEQAMGLLVSLAHDEEVTDDMLELGFDTLYRQMPDIILDVPDAPEMAKAFVVEAKKAGILGDSWTIPDPPPDED